MAAVALIAAERASAWMPAERVLRDAVPVLLEACVETLRITGDDADTWTGLAWTRDDGSGDPKRYRLVLPAEGAAPDPGARIRLRGRVRSAGPPLNPGEADPRQVEADIGIAGGVWVDAWTVVGSCEGFAATRAISRARRAYRSVIDSALPPAEAGLAAALAAGMQDGVDPADFDAFQATGTVHVLSVSGMHLALVTLVVFGLTRLAATLLFGRRASAWDPQAAASAAALAAAALYATFAGLSLATSRALVCTALACAAALAGGRAGAWNAWGAGIAVLLLQQPPAIRSPTFALSFLAVAGILAANGGPRAPRFRIRGEGARAWLAALLRWRWEAARAWPGSTARMTAGAAAATAPVVAAWFGRMPALGLAANAGAIPLFSLALVPLLVGAVVMPVSEEAARLCVLVSWPFLAAGRAVIAWVAAQPFCWLDVGLSAPAATALAIAVFTVLLARGVPRMVIASAALTIASLTASVAAPPPPSMEVTFLSVGQGDAAVVRFASGEVLLVDTGPETAGRRVIVPFLREMGVRRIDAIAISHAHPDHTGGLADVVRAFPVGELWLSGPLGEDEGLSAARVPLLARGTRVTGEGEGRRTRRTADGRGRIEMLAGDPSLRPEDAKERGSRNDRSLVIRVSEGAFSVLFTGDIESAGETALLHPERSLHATVVKVPHHGSSTSSGAAFVRATAPLIAIAQVGRDNRYEFPHAPVVGRWRAAGAAWLDTGRLGAVTLHACAERDGSQICGRAFVEPGDTMRY